ncbi:MAG: hypothetical protein K2M82_03690 [Lachnospiraceae bacterium]|nr:hypothetical protein [Lachnospiraceae bacterium]
MKKTTKILSAVVLCAVMLVMSVVPAFAATSDVTYVENHSVIDCTNRYKNNYGICYFTIKLPKNVPLIYCYLSFTRDYKGNDTTPKSTVLSNYKYMTYLYSDETSDYYELVSSKMGDEGVGIKLYCEYNGGYYMATDTSNGSTTEGSGYWLSV